MAYLLLFICISPCRELEVMTQLRSPQIVHFYGAATEPKFCMVLEYCANGSLFHYMQDGTHQVPWDLVLQWGQEIAKGVNALHSWKTAIVHRDLKSLNLLVCNLIYS
jgi:serine/threonine protein kinase